MEKNKSYTAEEFEKLALGDKKINIPQSINENIKNNIINLEDFKAIEKDINIARRAELMSRLQPKVNGISILTAEQVKDVYSNGLIDNPRFLNKIYRKFSNKKSTNPMMFVAEKDLRKVKQDMVFYVTDIIKKSKSSGENITIETLKKANKLNFFKNATNLGAGFAISAYFLSTAIPKIQYWITKLQTGKNNFPGVEKYNK